MTKRKKIYNMKDVLVSKRNLLVIYQTTFKKPKLVTRKNGAVICWKFEDCGLIKWSDDEKIVFETFCIGLLLIRCLSIVFSW